MSIIKSIFKVMKNGAWNEHYFKTSSDQVVHTKTDGQASTVKEQLDGLNSALGSVKFDLTNNSSTVIDDDGCRRAFGIYDKTSKTVRLYAQCNFSADNTLQNTFRIPAEYKPKTSAPCLCISTRANSNILDVRPGWASQDGFLSAVGGTAVARAVLYIAEYQI